MRKIILSFFLIVFTAAAIAQTESDQKINEGIELHDKGEYESAIRKYDEVLKSDPGNSRALYEKSYSLFHMKKYDECEVLCKQLLQGKLYKKEVYVQYGNLLDMTNRQNEAIELYNKGIKEFPDFNLLYFNRGIALSGMEKDDDAILSFQQGVKLKPLHASSHYAIGKLSQDDSRVPAMMALFTFLVIEPESERSKESLRLLNRLANKGVSRTDSTHITISVDASTLEKKKKRAENDFSNTEVILSLGASLAEGNDSLKAKTITYQLNSVFDLIIASLSEGKKKGRGFYWTFYAPFLIELESKGFLETAAYIAHASSDNAEVNQWLESNSNKTSAFYDWLKNYSWNTK